MPDPTSRGDQPPTIADAIGGPAGMVESSVPAVAFVIAYSASGSDTRLSAGIAVGLAALIAVARLVRRRVTAVRAVGARRRRLRGVRGDPQREGRELLPARAAGQRRLRAAFLISIAVRRPLVGIVVGAMDGEGSGWRDDPLRVRSFTRASWLWAGLFLARLAVQLPLYLASAVVALGVARTAMGLPLFALGLWLTWRLVHRTRPAPGRTQPGGAT